MNERKRQGVGEAISFDEAMGAVLGTARPLGVETVPLENAGGRVLADDVVSDIDMPPFDKAAMDGFACRSADLDHPLRIVETVAAGSMPGRTIGEEECARIMTGAVVPKGADTVVMVEDTEESGGIVRIVRRRDAANICIRGEDVRAGDTVLTAGILLEPAHIAILAAVGSARVPVRRRPTLGIVATGDELVEPGDVPPPGSIRNGNGPQLTAQARAAGFPAEYLGIAPDTPDSIRETIRRGDGRIDVFIVSGGVSMGDYDHVPAVLEREGFDLLVRRVAIKPGKPLLFGHRGDAWVFGLPGNPVSSFVIFEVVVRPFCHRLMEHSFYPRKMPMRLGRAVARRRPERLEFLPVRIEADGVATPVEYHGSAHIHAYRDAGGILVIPAGVERIEEGETAQIILLS